MLQKQSVNINFAQGVDTKTDPWQVPVGKFLNLENTIFTKYGLLQKRNGFGKLAELPYSSFYLTTFQGALTAIGSQLQTLAENYSGWVNQGQLVPIEISSMGLVNNSLNQTQCDSVISSNNLICTVYTEINGASTLYKYVIADQATGQNIKTATTLTDADATYGTPRVFTVGNYFVIVYTYLVSATYRLKYVAISINNPTGTTQSADLSQAYTPSATLGWNGVLQSATGNLFIAYNAASSAGIYAVYLTPQLQTSNTIVLDSTKTATMITMSVLNPVNNRIIVTYYSSSTKNAYSVVFNTVNLAIVNVPFQVITNETVANLAGYFSGLTTYTYNLFYDVTNAYSYDSSIPTNYISQVVVTISGATVTVGTSSVLKRSVGLASKGFAVSNYTYPCVLTVYQSPYQSTYFLIDSQGNILSRFAYQNAGGYLTKSLPQASVVGSVVSIPYLNKNVITPVNKNTNISAGNQTAGIYAQTGVNLISFDFAADPYSVEIGQNLNITGGYTYAFDGDTVAEQSFFLYPSSIKATFSTTGGSMNSAYTYYYVVTYEWSDNQGNIFRSAPSIPVVAGPSGATATASCVLNIPTLRLTNKQNVKICVYRWSSNQQTYYQCGANYLTSPLLNNTAVDSVTFTDTQADSSILGNNALYTTGGVVENICPPAFKTVFLFDNRMWGISAEDRNLLWFSKPVIENTPVEMSDLFTRYISPNIGAQGPSGGLTAAMPMDDKAILFKASSILYFNGVGPDITGANDQYSQPLLITATVGCSNQKSLVFMPNGLMFEFSSNAGNQIWLLGRDLSTNYIGAAVEKYTQNASILSAVNIPGTNQVRFTLSSGITLMYDYYFQQWGTFTNIDAQSSCLYEGLHTFINSSSQVLQETPGQYLDGTNPVTVSFKTSWVNLMGIQGYQRAYFFYLLGKYISPHKLLCEVSYDFNDAPVQGSLIVPTNFNPTYGSAEPNGQQTQYGQGSFYGGNSNVESWRVFLTKQRCSAFQITVTEYFDPAYNTIAGEGLTLSGLNLIVAAKQKFRTQSALESIGG